MGMAVFLIKFYLNTGNKLMGHSLPTPTIRYHFSLTCGKFQDWPAPTQIQKGYKRDNLKECKSWLKSLKVGQGGIPLHNTLKNAKVYVRPIMSPEYKPSRHLYLLLPKVCTKFSSALAHLLMSPPSFGHLLYYVAKLSPGL